MPVQCGAPNSCGWETAEVPSKVASIEFASVNTKDSGKRKKGTYMGPAWTRDHEGPVARQGKSMSTLQHIDYLLAL